MYCNFFLAKTGKDENLVTVQISGQKVQAMEMVLDM